MRILRMIIECMTPLHCGAGAGDLLDETVSRDAFGCWRIPGASLAGSLRALALEMDASQDKTILKELFGCQKEEESQASLVWCEDGRLLDFDDRLAMRKHLAGEEVKIDCSETWARDHVRLSLDYGTAENGAKYDEEIVPPGARFLLDFRCDGWKKPLNAEQLKFFDELAASVRAGRLDLGGKRGLAYGEYRVIEYQYAEFDLSDSQGMEAWLNLPEEGSFPKGAREIELPKAPEGGKLSGLTGSIEAPLNFNGPVLIGGGVAGKDAVSSEADMLFALAPRLEYGPAGKAGVKLEPVLPASAIRGLFRHTIYGILKDLGCGKERAEKILDGIFGKCDGNEVRCGKLIFRDAKYECLPDSPRACFMQHVAIDRFSAAAITGALFSEEVCWWSGGKALFRIRACGLDSLEAFLFFHAFLDLCAGLLPIGGGVNRGNGRMRLAGWEKDPQTALENLGGELSWNGEAICANGGTMEQLRKFSAEWDRSLKERI